MTDAFISPYIYWQCYALFDTTRPCSRCRSKGSPPRALRMLIFAWHSSWLETDVIIERLVLAWWAQSSSSHLRRRCSCIGAPNHNVVLWLGGMTHSGTSFRSKPRSGLRGSGRFYCSFAMTLWRPSLPHIILLETDVLLYLIWLEPLPPSSDLVTQEGGDARVRYIQVKIYIV